MDDLLRRIEAEALQGDMAIDREVYEAVGKRPTLPVLLGSGSLQGRIGVFGRDPGRTEVEVGEGFIGKGGALIRTGLHRARFGTEPRSQEDLIRAGQTVLWANTVPYKPVGNKAWSVKVKRRFLPMIQELLVEHWTGQDLICCGNVAFDWFRLADRSLKEPLAEFWARPDRYEASLTVELAGKELRLHPLPHPSPLNATWFKRFPDLLAQRLIQLGWTGEQGGLS